jgi:hypothetical protein
VGPFKQQPRWSFPVSIWNEQDQIGERARFTID